MSVWQTNWPINWSGNSVGMADPPLQTRQHYSISAALSVGVLPQGINVIPLGLIHTVDGGGLTATGRLILTRRGSRG
ncbi:MAG: hypothetical protein V1897_03680 [Pseudomonadota bacterium]